jgi:hypothetical protein
MLIAGVSLLLSVFVLVSARLLYDRSHVFFLLCTAIEGWLKRHVSRSDKLRAGSPKVRRAAAR